MKLIGTKHSIILSLSFSRLSFWLCLCLSISFTSYSIWAGQQQDKMLKFKKNMSKYKTFPPPLCQVNFLKQRGSKCDIDMSQVLGRKTFAFVSKK